MKPLEYAKIFGLIGFTITLLTSSRYFYLPYSLFDAIIASLIWGFSAYFISISYKKRQVKFKHWMLYVIGWIWGLFNPIFWFIMILAHLQYNWGEPFFNARFHKRVYYFGIFVFATILIILISFIFYFT